ncbi:radical SAM protein [Candidatus Lokiarchaeum ossiferum]|uniref:radical SAM protein n=1 Tax=Candidatus Lokiarchaeum ossiferum TaxID=2951803 RepID=UPI00352CC723
MNQKLLLTAVFGPYGVKDAYAEGIGMQMELLNNQITRQQGIHSPRQNYWTFALYLLAENISTPTTVLDFPKWKDFTHELNTNHYTHVGINFIVPNVLKAKRMTEYIRKFHPKIKIILGGYGTTIPNLEKMVPHDELCIGEGVRWMQKYFGEVDRLTQPVIHPVIQNPISQRVYGYRSVPRAAVLLPGLGCENGCEFCATSHMFNKKYEPLLANGQECFEACLKAETEMKASGFSIMDENFLKQPNTARDLLKAMESNMKNYAFEIFSSAETITSLGIDFLVRLGVKMVWVGVESKEWAHSKVKNVDFTELFAKLQNNGITVNSSAILFLEHHDEKSLQEDIDWVISLEADLTQFMNYTPLPNTTLYKRLKETSKLKSQEEVPYAQYHGAAELNWIHPHINDPKKHFEYLKQAFRKKYLTNGSGILNMTITSLLGLKSARKDFAYREENGINWNPITLKYEKSDSPHHDAYFKYRLRKIERVAMISRPMLLPLYLLAPNKSIRNKTKAALRLARETLGKPTIQERIKSFALVIFALIEGIKFTFMKIRGKESIIYQPKARKVDYNMESHTVLAIVKHQIKKWVRLDKPYHWVQDQLRTIPSKAELLRKIQNYTKFKKTNLSLSKMQECWVQMISKQDYIQNYWINEGGKV